MEYTTATNVLNDAAVELGLAAVTDPVANTDQAYVQLRYLLNSAGRRLVRMHEWERLVGAHSITTTALDTGEYALPDDFSYMINQTGWEQQENVPLIGPLTAQDWTYLKGRDLVDQTIYVSFRLQKGVFTIYPNDPVPAGLNITFEYIANTWVLDTDGTTRQASVDTGTDEILYDRTLITQLTKALWLDSKGFDSTRVWASFNELLEALTGQEKGAPILNAGMGRGRLFPLLHPLYNTPDTGYGSTP